MELGSHLIQRDTILGAQRACEAGPDIIQVQLQCLCEIGIGRRRIVEETLGLRIRFHQLQQLFGPTSTTHVINGLVVNREEAHSRPILWCHVGNGRAVG